MSQLTMQAVRFHEYGGPELLVLEQVPRPQPQADQMLIRVLAAGVNPADASMRAVSSSSLCHYRSHGFPAQKGQGLSKR